MKATDLMLGDWVKSRGKIEQVRVVYEGHICTDSFEDSHDYYFEPIPLTPKILEKNGFAKTPEWTGNTFFALADDFYLIQIEEYSDSIWRFCYRSREFDMPPTQILFCFVHELQHCLKLVGMEKNIEL